MIRPRTDMSAVPLPAPRSLNILTQIPLLASTINYSVNETEKIHTIFFQKVIYEKYSMIYFNISQNKLKAIIVLNKKYMLISLKFQCSSPRQNNNQKKSSYV